MIKESPRLFEVPTRSTRQTADHWSLEFVATLLSYYPSKVIAVCNTEACHLQQGQLREGLARLHMPMGMRERDRLPGRTVPVGNPLAAVLGDLGRR
jgi:hypothetical protein